MGRIIVHFSGAAGGESLRFRTPMDWSMKPNNVSEERSGFKVCKGWMIRMWFRLILWSQVSVSKGGNGEGNKI